MQTFNSGRFEASNPNSTDANQRQSLATVNLAEAAKSPGGADFERRDADNRRSAGLRAFFYGNFHPRRRNHRRASDQHFILFDWYEPRILYLALCVLLLSCADALFTLKLLTAGASEANAVMAAMLESGVDHFLAAKIGLTSFSLVILVAAARRRFFRTFSVENMLQLLCGGYILVIYYEIYLFRFVFDLNIF